MTKVTANQIYRQIYEKNKDEILIQTSGVVRYTLEKFSKDMRANDLISSTRTIREKWAMLVSNEIIFDERRDHSSGMLNVHLLELKVLGYSKSKDPLMMRSARARVSGLFISELDAAREGAQ